MPAENDPDNNLDAEIARFWGDFQIFPFKVEQVVFGNSWLLAAVVLLPFVLRLSISILADVRSASKASGDSALVEGPWALTVESFDQWILILVTLGLLPIVWVFKRWLSMVPGFFNWLLESDRIYTDGGDVKEAYLAYLEGYQQGLFSKKGRLLCVMTGIVLLVIWQLVLGSLQSLMQEGEYLLLARNFIPYGLGYLLWVILFGFGIWSVFATGRQIRRITTYFNVRIRPSHPDKCGGLAPIGNFCFDMVLPIMLGIVMVILIALGAALIEGTGVLSSIGLELDVPWITVVIIVFGAIVVVTPLMTFAFFSPLLGIHQVMVEKKRKAEEVYGNKITELEKRVQRVILTDGDVSVAKEAKEKIETFQIVDPSRIGYPAWPFRQGTVLSLFSPQIIVTAAGLAAAIKSLLE